MNLYFLGPCGTYSEKSAKKAKTILNIDCNLTPVSTIAKIVNLVESNENSIGIVPIENSIEGIVRPTIDALYLSQTKIQIQINIEIRHCLISKGEIKDVKHIISHPQALAQSSDFILNNFDEKIDLISSNSTAEAINSLKEKDASYAAIGSMELAQNLNLNVLAQNIGNIKDNKTRFALISKNKIKISDDTRTSIVFNTKNEPGALLKILEIFNKYKLNLIYLESRPSKKIFGEYNFFADIDKGYDEILTPLHEIKKECNFYRLLGSYPTC